MILRYNRYFRDPERGYTFCCLDSFWRPSLCHAVENAVTGIFQNSQIAVSVGQRVQQTCWLTADGANYYMICQMIKEVDNRPGDSGRNVYTVDLYLGEFESEREETLFFYNYENIFFRFHELYDKGASCMQKPRPELFAPYSLQLYDMMDPQPQGFIKKFVPDPVLNERCLEAAAWLSSKRGHGLLMNFSSFNGVLECVRNLYHMLPLYARMQFGFSSYVFDATEKLSHCPGLCLLCTQKGDRPTPAVPPGFGLIDFCSEVVSTPNQTGYFYRAFKRIVKADKMDEFNRFLQQNWHLPEVQLLIKQDSLPAQEALFARYAQQYRLNYFSPTATERQAILEYLQRL